MISTKDTTSNNHGDLNLQRFCHQKAISLENNPYLERQSQFESNARSYPRSFPIAIKRARGIYIEDTAEQVFIDCLAGAGTLALGHNHPSIHQALQEHLASGAPLHTLDITTPAKDAFIEQLFKILPSEFTEAAKVHFCGPTGADAVEAAIKLAKIATQRGNILAFSGAYHGMTQSTLGLMGNLATKSPVKSLGVDVQFLPYPNQYRCPFGLSGDQTITSNLNYIESLFVDPQSGVLPPAAIIVEAIQGEGGVITAPEHWLKGLRHITQKYSIPLIFDEVQCGIGRSGKMFAFEYADITPDIIIISKAIGGGLPLSIIVYNQKLDKWAPGAHTGTFRGNQLAMVAGTVTLQIIIEQQLCKNANAMGHRLKQQLISLQTQFPQLGEVRGRGLMLGVEIVDINRPTARLSPPPPAPELASAIQNQCLNNGLILETGGRNSSTLRFLPPLIIKKEEIDKIAEIFHNATKQAISDLNLSTTDIENITA